MHTHRAIIACTLGIGLLWAPALRAVIFTVGGDAGCNFSSIQAAITAAQNDADPAATIRIARSETYTGIALDINAHVMSLEGGYDTCGDPLPSGQTTISGAGGTADTVIDIRAASGGPFTVTLKNLAITQGDPGAGKFGGGIQITGGNYVTLVNVSVHNNSSDRGGGIYIDGGSVVNTRLTMDLDSQVFSNTANQSGGGVHCVNINDNLQYVSLNANVFGNNAVNGGGVYLDNCTLRHRALTIGDGVFFNNASGSGGGAYVANNSLFSVTGNPDILGVVSLNTATLDGGGVYLSGDSDYDASSAQMIDNFAGRNGGAVYQDSGDFSFRSNILCPLDRCARIESNRANGQGGAIYQLAGGLNIQRTWITDNSSPDGSVIKSEGGMSQFDSIVAARNRNATTVMRLKNGDHSILWSTFADNEDMSSTLLLTGGTLDLQGTIIWETQGDALAFFGGVTAWTVECMLAHNLPALISGPDILFVNPQFRDPAA